DLWRARGRRLLRKGRDRPQGHERQQEEGGRTPPAGGAGRPDEKGKTRQARQTRRRRRGGVIALLPTLPSGRVKPPKAVWGGGAFLRVPQSGSQFRPNKARELGTK